MCLILFPSNNFTSSGIPVFLLTSCYTNKVFLSICEERIQNRHERQLTLLLRGFVILLGTILTKKRERFVMCIGSSHYFCFLLCFFYSSLFFSARTSALGIQQGSLSLVLRFGFLVPTLRTVSPAQHQQKAYRQKTTNGVGKVAWIIKNLSVKFFTIYNRKLNTLIQPI